MRSLLTLALVLALVAPVRAETAAVQVLTATGEPSDWGALGRALDESEILFVGEDHDDALGHQQARRILELARTRAAATKRPVALGLEMFERDVQLVLDEYVTGLVREKDFLKASRPWPNYEKDYRPLIEYARTEGLMVIATNAPERYVSRVGRLGAASLGALSAEACRWLAPLPYPGASGAYADKIRRLMSDPEADAARPHAAVPQDLLDAQALRDATMAHSLARFLDQHPGALVVHLNGRFHSDGRLGVPEQLLGYRRGTKLRVVTLATREAQSPLEGPARREDFVIRRAAPAGRPPAGAGTPSPATPGPAPVH